MKIGDAIKGFTLPGTDGEFCLSQCRGQIVVLYFYPKDDTPGCAIESNDFSNMLDDFHAANAVVVGISRDSVKSHEKFRAKFNYAHHLISDKDEVLCNRFAVIKNKTMFGKAARGIARSTFLIDQNGKLAREWRNIKDVTGHAAEVLLATKQL